MTLHMLTASEKAALRQFYLPPLPEGWAGVFVRDEHLHTGLPMRVLFRLGLIETHGDLTPRGATFRLTGLGVQALRILEVDREIAIEDPGNDIERATRQFETHTLSHDEKAFLRSFHRTHGRDGYFRFIFLPASTSAHIAITMLGRLRLIEQVSTTSVRTGYRLTPLAVGLLPLLEELDRQVVVPVPPAQEQISIHTHSYLDNLMPDAEEPELTELTELELEILRAFEPGTGNQPGLFYRLLDAEYEAASDAIVSLQGQGHISFEGHSMDSGIYRLRPSGYWLRRRAMESSGTIEETPALPPTPIQSGQRRLRNRNKK